MRLSSQEIQIIKKIVKNEDQDAQIYLFGSRVDDEKKGGDIDLLIFSLSLNDDDKYKIKCDLWDQLGEQKIDIIIASDNSDPFTRIALRKAVLL